MPCEVATILADWELPSRGHNVSRKKRGGKTRIQTTTQIRNDDSDKRIPHPTERLHLSMGTRTQQEKNHVSDFRVKKQRSEDSLPPS